MNVSHQYMDVHTTATILTGHMIALVIMVTFLQMIESPAMVSILLATVAAVLCVCMCIIYKWK